MSMTIKYYRVGGCVRDEYMGLRAHDIDYAVEAPSYDAMKDDLIARGVKIFMEKPEFNVIRGSHPKYGGVDYVLCRKDGTYSDNRRPDFVESGSIHDDLRRRDLTINAMAIEEDTGKLIDPHNGKVDLENGILRCVGDPMARLSEDCLRILRIIRFAIKFEFLIHKDTLKAMNALAQTVTNLPVDRVRDELEKCFRLNTIETFYYLSDFGLLQPIFDNPAYKLWLVPTNKDK